MVGDDITTERRPESRILGLDLLRAVAAWLVLLSHVAFWSGLNAQGDIGVMGGLAARGEVGVAIFFALSAFLLSAPLIRRALGSPTSWSMRTYALRRVARILPAYLLALVAVVVAAALIGAAATDALDLPTVLIHLIIGQGWTGRTFQSFTQTWSLTTEVSFYLILPLIALGAHRMTRGASPVESGRRLLWLLGLTTIIGLLAQTGAAALTHPQTAGILGTSILGHAAWFAIGAGIAVLVEAERAGITLTSRPIIELLRTSPGTLIILAGALWLVAATPIAGPRGLEPAAPGAAFASEVLYGLIAACLLCAATSRGVSEGLSARPSAGLIRWLGNTSYGVFLWHVLVLQVAFAALDLSLFAAPFAPLLLLVTVFSLGAAHLSWTLVERRFVVWAHRERHAAARTSAPRD